MEASTPRRGFSRSRVVRQLILAFSGLLLLAMAVAAVSLYRIAAGLDEREAEKTRFYVESVLNQLQKSEKAYLLTHADWEAAYEHLVASVDTQWAYNEDNVGPTLYSTDGYAGVFVIDDAVTPYAMLRGKLSDVSIEQLTPVKAQILQSARAAADSEQAVTGYLRFNGHPALYTAAVIRPPERMHHLPAARSVLVFIRLLSPETLAEMGRSIGLDGLQTTAREDSADLRLGDSGYGLVWNAPQPGRDLLWSVLPPMGIAALIIVLLMAFFARQAIGISARLDRHHRQLLASKAALETSEERFKAVAEAASDWIWETDEQLRITYLSERFAVITGYPVLQWMGRPITSLLDCDTHELELWLRNLGALDATGSLRCHYHDTRNQQRICRISARAIIRERHVQGFRGTSSDITDEVAAHAQIQHLSLHDALTGLPNRNKLLRFLETVPVGRSGLAVLMLDLDSFKPINDSLGHPAGDAVLTEVAARLNQITRESDLVARLGGDEFVLVLSRAGTRDELDRFCARMVTSLQQPMYYEGHPMQVGVSIGVVLSREHPGQPQELIRYADVALYNAKQAGKGTWRYFSAQMNEALMGKRTLERELREGIPRGELVLHFQPRYKVDGISVASVEALVRWQHPKRGLLRPDAFIALAEESDLIVLLGNWVLHEACARAREWPLEVMVSVNMSPAQFARSDVVEDVRAALVATRLPAHRLELEITENVMLNDVEGALRTMNALKELGVRLNMDDFGTGYSSLGYLRTYPFDSIKIDRRFIESLGRSASDRSVVQAIINLGNAMGMTVTAEGVETQDQLNLLSADCCHEVQGYLLSRPVENAALVKLMAQDGEGPGARPNASPARQPSAPTAQGRR